MPFNVTIQHNFLKKTLDKVFLKNLYFPSRIKVAYIHPLGAPLRSMVMSGDSYYSF